MIDTEVHGARGDCSPAELMVRPRVAPRRTPLNRVAELFGDTA